MQKFKRKVTEIALAIWDEICWWALGVYLVAGAFKDWLKGRGREK